MSISLISAPNEYSPGYNPIRFVVDGTNKASCDYQYICDIYINSVFITRLREFPFGDNDYGYFSIERIIQDYLSYDLHTELTGFAANPNGIVSYYCEFRERYGSASPCDGDTTLQAVTYTSPVKYAWNGALQVVDFYNYVETNYVLNGTQSRFLTRIPDNFKIRTDAWFNLDFLQYEDDPACTLEIKTYDYSGDLIGTYFISSPFDPTPTTSQLKVSVGVGPENLNAATLSSGSQPVIDEDVYSYTVQMLDCSSPGVALSEIKYFSIDTRCLKYDTKAVSFWNRLGGFDSYIFTSRSNRFVDISKRTFDKILSNDFTLTDRGTTVISVDARERYTYNTDWLTEDEGLWMEELFTSPEAYLKLKQETEVQITGVVYLSGTVGMVLSQAVSVGTPFTYVIDGSAASALGISATGSGTIVGFNGTQHETDIPALINAGALTEGTLTATIVNTQIPIVVASTQFEEKLKNNVKNIKYSVDFTASHKKNIQSL